jgi:hypothetical protein
MTMRTLRFCLAAHQDSGCASAALEPTAPDVDALADLRGPGGGTPKAAAEQADRRVRRRDLLNLLNYVNFREGTIFVSFRNAERGDVVSYQAVPLPCVDERLACRWVPPGIRLDRLQGYECDQILLSDGRSHVTVKAKVLELDAQAAVFELPEAGYEKAIRSIDRFSCEGVEARLIQQGICFEGVIVDFNAVSCRIELGGASVASIRWLNPASPVMALFSKGGTLLYSGECEVRRMSAGRSRSELVLIPNASGARRYPPRRYRSERFSLAPAPIARFRHPFTGRKVDLQVKDISGSGIRVEEFFEHSMLLPGLVIPEMSIEIGSSYVLTCRAQVLYRNVSSAEDRRSSISCGIVFLDMEPQDQVALSSFLHQSHNDRLRICGSVDMEELWRFFFESGFIYPAKYASMQPRKEDFKRTYERLYMKSPSIARHFLFQDKGRLFGHMSMIRFYPNTWMIHHHAAARSGYGSAGVEVLDQVGRFGNEFYHHPSAHIDYLLCYYREENRFPARVFGGVAREIADPKGSSVDALSYLYLPAEEGIDEPFQIFPAREDDLAEARSCYEKASGGLMLDVLDLIGDPEGPDNASLNAEFSRQGFRRERRVFSLRLEGRLEAMISITISDTGLNLSNLTNCAHAIVIDPERLKPRTLMSALRALLGNYSSEDMPVLVFPSSYLKGSDIPLEKEYTLWALDMDRADSYFEALNKIFKRRPDEDD